MKKIKIGYSGLSHLGICSSIASASKGYEIISYDGNNEIIEDLNNGKFQFYEPKLKQQLKKVKHKIKFTNKIDDLKLCKIVFISKDVPTNLNGKSEIKSVKVLVEKTRGILKKNTILVILSQVLPGFTNNIKWNKNFLYYQVETLIFGKGLDRALNPERLIIGSNNSKINKILKTYLNSFNCEILTMNYVSAELSKILINTYLIFSITFTNLMSSISENIGANWNDIKKVLKTDARIGKKAYLSPSFGIGGSNLKRDLVNLTSFTKKNTKENKFLKSISQLSDQRINIIIKKFKKNYKKKNMIFSILGVTYKENTSSLKNSPAINLIKKLDNYKFQYYDPIIKDLEKNYKNVKFVNLKKILKNSDVLVFLTPWKEFYKISKKEIIKNKNLTSIIDPYCILNKKNFDKINYFSFENQDDKK